MLMKNINKILTRRYNRSKMSLTSSQKNSKNERKKQKILKAQKEIG